MQGAACEGSIAVAATTLEIAPGSSTWDFRNCTEPEPLVSPAVTEDCTLLHVRLASGFPQDAMGSVLGLADGSGQSVARYEYDAFGNIRSATGVAASIPAEIGWDFRYHGMQYDSTTLLYHVRARTYDARTGRFLTRDPFEGRAHVPETYLPYAFVNNNPQAWRDPTGEFMADISIAGVISGILAATSISALTTLAKTTFGARWLKAEEEGFLQGHFGGSINPSAIRVAGGGNPIDPSRAWAPWRGVIQLPNSHFVSGDPMNIIDLGNVSTKSTFGHEALHEWQRLQGRWVSAAGLFYGGLDAARVKYGVSFLSDPYDYGNPQTQEEMFAAFILGNIEQQGQIFQDYLKNYYQGQSTSVYSLVVAFVQDPVAGTFDLSL